MGRTLCTEIVFDIQNNFCTQHGLPMFCKKNSFWQRFACIFPLTRTANPAHIQHFWAFTWGGNHWDLNQHIYFKAIVSAVYIQGRLILQTIFAGKSKYLVGLESRGRQMFYTSFWKPGALVLASNNSFWKILISF